VAGTATVTGSGSGREFPGAKPPSGASTGTATGTWPTFDVPKTAMTLAVLIRRAHVDTSHWRASIYQIYSLPDTPIYIIYTPHQETGTTKFSHKSATSQRHEYLYRGVFIFSGFRFIIWRVANFEC